LPVVVWDLADFGEAEFLAPLQVGRAGRASMSRVPPWRAACHVRCPPEPGHRRRRPLPPTPLTSEREWRTTMDWLFDPTTVSSTS